MSTSSTSSNGSDQWISQNAEGRYYKLEKIKNLLKQTFPSKSEAEFQVTVSVLMILVKQTAKLNRAVKACKRRYLVDFAQEINGSK
jgi:hypothetical protein